MHPKLLLTLQRIFWALGWFILISAVGHIGVEVYEHFRPDEGGVFQEPKRPFYFFASLKILFSYMAQAFFAFLMSVVFEMVFQRGPVRRDQPEVFLRLTCIGFFGEGLIGVIEWARYIVVILPHYDLHSLFGVAAYGTYFLSLSSSLISFVYALTIYILYRHFTNLVTFESEVV